MHSFCHYSRRYHMTILTIMITDIVNTNLLLQNPNPEKQTAENSYLIEVLSPNCDYL